MPGHGATARRVDIDDHEIQRRRLTGHSHDIRQVGAGRHDAQRRVDHVIDAPSEDGQYADTVAGYLLFRAGRRSSTV